MLRPVPGDPSAETVAAMVDLRSDDWLFTARGDYSSSAVEAMKADGSNFQRVIALEWPARRRGADTDHVTVRLLISPEDAIGLADVLIHTAAWLQAAEELGR